VHVIYLVFADGFNWPKIIARQNSDIPNMLDHNPYGRNKVCRCHYGTMRTIVRLIVMGRLCELCVILLVDSMLVFVFYGVR
jgi:hypothetical protein